MSVTVPVRVCKCHGFICKISGDTVLCSVDGHRLYGAWRVEKRSISPRFREQAEVRPSVPPPSIRADREISPEQVSAVMAAMGRRGGRKGGLARAAALTPEQRSTIARRAARARWGTR